MASRGNRRRQSAVNAAIVDTDVVSMLFKGDTRAVAYRAHITGKLFGISFLTRGLLRVPFIIRSP